MRRKAFTLVELMTVVAILAILYAILMPVVLQVRNYAQQYVAGEAMVKIGQATTMYMADADDTFPLGYYPAASGRQNWFGILDKNGEVIPNTSLLAPYTKGRIQVDMSLNAKPWEGDASGFGYNWGYLGSDYYEKDSTSSSLTCNSPATSSSLHDTSETIELGTSSFYYAKWLPRGDAMTYRYGFIDPPKVWFGNPTLDFRHMATKIVNEKKHEVDSNGVALVVYVDGHLKTAHQKKVTNEMFSRQGSGVSDLFGDN